MVDDRRWILPPALAAPLAATLLALPFVPLRLNSIGNLAVNAGHLPLLFLVTLLLYELASRWRRRSASTSGPGGAVPQAVAPRGLHLIAAATIAVAAAAAIEMFQPWIGRSASWMDLVAGWIGVALAVAGILVWQTPWARRLRLAHAAVTLIIGVALMVPAWLEWRSLVWRAESFPVLADLEHPLEMRLWRAEGGWRSEQGKVLRVARHASHGTHALEVWTAAGSWAGASYRAGCQSWNDHQTMRFEVHNPGAPFDLRVRVESNDDRRQRFVQILPLPHGDSQQQVTMDAIRADTSRGQVDLQCVTLLAFSTGHEQPARVFHVDHVRLEPAAPQRTSLQGER